MSRSTPHPTARPRRRPARTVVATIAVVIAALAASAVALAGPSDDASESTAGTTSAVTATSTSTTSPGTEPATVPTDGPAELGLTDAEATGWGELLPAEAGAVDAPSAEDAPVLPPVELDAVPPVAPPATPEDVDVLAGVSTSHGGPTSLVGNAQGCAARCITRAAISFVPDSTELHVEVQTDRRARIRVALSTDAPTVVDGVPTFVDPIVAQSHMRRTNLARTISGLAPDTTYHVVVTATDAAGGVHHAGTSLRTSTPVIAGGPGSPASCEPGCFAAARVVDLDHDGARLQISTSVAVRLEVAVSTQEPGWIGGVPFLPADIPVDVPTGSRLEWDVPIDGLAPGTTHHVVVRAVDVHGGHSIRAGRFTTAAAPATFVATFREITVIRDGDPGLLGAGELSFAWGGDGLPGGGRAHGNHDDGDRITVHTGTTSEFSIAPGAIGPRFHVSATEYDKPQDLCTSNGANWVPLHTEPAYDEVCRRRTNPASSGLLSAETIRSLPSCRTYGVVGDGEDDRCLMIRSVHQNDDYPDIWALVSFREL